MIACARTIPRKLHIGPSKQATVPGPLSYRPEEYIAIISRRVSLPNPRFAAHADGRFVPLFFRHTLRDSGVIVLRVHGRSSRGWLLNHDAILDSSRSIPFPVQGTEKTDGNEEKSDSGERHNRLSGKYSVHGAPPERPLQSILPFTCRSRASLFLYADAHLAAQDSSFSSATDTFVRGHP